jgi:hypothetical protein
MHGGRACGACARWSAAGMRGNVPTPYASASGKEAHACWAYPLCRPRNTTSDGVGRPWPSISIYSRTFFIHLWTSHDMQMIIIHKLLSTKQKQSRKHFEQHNSVQPATTSLLLQGGHTSHYLRPTPKSYFHSSFMAISCLLFCA